MGWVLAWFLAIGVVPLAAQLRERKDAPPQEPQGIVEEDEDLFVATEYAFNPIQAQKDVKIGDFYAKKGNHRAAAGRYLEATRWNPNFAEAYWKLGRSREKIEQPREALVAYRKYLELDPTGKWVRDVKKKLASLERQVETLPAAEEALSKNKP